MRIAKIVAALCVVLVLAGCGTTQTITKTVAENTVTQYVTTITRTEQGQNQTITIPSGVVTQTQTVTQPVTITAPVVTQTITSVSNIPVPITITQTLTQTVTTTPLPAPAPQNSIVVLNLYSQSTIDVVTQIQTLTCDFFLDNNSNVNFNNVRLNVTLGYGLFQTPNIAGLTLGNVFPFNGFPQWNTLPLSSGAATFQNMPSFSIMANQTMEIAVRFSITFGAPTLVAVYPFNVFVAIV